MPDRAEPKRLIVIANQTCPCPGLADAVRRHAPSPAEVLIVCPALNGRLAHLMSDVDGAVEAARARLHTALVLLADAGVPAGGEIGDGDPLVAIDDALARFAADELMISTHPPGASHWLEKNLVQRARERFDMPVYHHVSVFGLAAH